MKGWSCAGIAPIRFLLMETRMFQAPEGGEIIEPGGVSPGVTAQTGKLIPPSPRMGAAPHRPGREPRGKPGSANGAALQGLDPVSRDAYSGLMPRALLSHRFAVAETALLRNS